MQRSDRSSSHIISGHNKAQGDVSSFHSQLFQLKNCAVLEILQDSSTESIDAILVMKEIISIKANLNTISYYL